MIGRGARDFAEFWYGGPLVRAGPPGPAGRFQVEPFREQHGPARGPVADEGVRPTMDIKILGGTKPEFCYGLLV